MATFTLLLSVLTGTLSALTAPKLGSLSDRYGRKRLMAIASCGGVLNEIITILAAKYSETVSYQWLILGAFFDGITGSFTAGSLLSHSYTSDCSPPSRRGVHIAYLHACLFTGLAFGPLLAGYFVKWTGELLSIFYVTLACHVFFITFVYLVAPESLSKKRQRLAREKHRAERAAAAENLRAGLPDFLARAAGPRAAGFLNDSLGAGTWLPALLGANPLAPLRILAPRGPSNRALRRNIILLAGVDAIIMSTAIGAGTVTILYSEYMFDWGTLEASQFVSVTSLVRVFVLMCLFPIVNYVFRIRPMRQRQRQQQEQQQQQQAASGAPTTAGPPHVETNAGADELDVWLLRVALLSDLVGLTGYVFARTGSLFVLSGVVASFGGIGSAVIQSSITKHVPAERVGSLLGALGLLHALGRVVSPILFNGLYAATVESFPQAFFVLLASIFGLALIASLFVRPHCESLSFPLQLTSRAHLPFLHILSSSSLPHALCQYPPGLKLIHIRTVYLKEDDPGYTVVPVRDPGEDQGSDALADDDMQSATLPRIS